MFANTFLCDRGRKRFVSEGDGGVVKNWLKRRGRATGGASLASPGCFPLMATMLAVSWFPLSIVSLFMSAHGWHLMKEDWSVAFGSLHLVYPFCFVFWLLFFFKEYSLFLESAEAFASDRCLFFKDCSNQGQSDDFFLCLFFCQFHLLPCLYFLSIFYECKGHLTDKAKLSQHFVFWFNKSILIFLPPFFRQCQDIFFCSGPFDPLLLELFSLFKAKYWLQKESQSKRFFFGRFWNYFKLWLSGTQTGVSIHKSHFHDIDCVKVIAIA